jgi:hypothetical protein
LPDLDPSLSRRIADAARAVQIAKHQLEQARTFEEKILFQKSLERAEEEMNNVAMNVNRGLSRAAPST